MPHGCLFRNAVLAAGVALAACRPAVIAPPPAGPRRAEAPRVPQPERPPQPQPAIVEIPRRPPIVVRLYIGPAQEGQTVTVDVETRVARVVAVDGEPLPQAAGINNGIALELLPGDHCVQLVSPRLWDAFRHQPQELPPQMSMTNMVWFDAKPGASYRIFDDIQSGKMFDRLQIFISELGRNTPGPAVFRNTSPPAHVHCRFFEAKGR